MNVKLYSKLAVLITMVASLLLFTGCVMCGQHTGRQPEQPTEARPPPIDYPTNIPK